MQCPAGAILRRAESRREPSYLRVLYRASSKDCAKCVQWAACRGRPSTRVSARSISVLEPLPVSGASPQPRVTATRAATAGTGEGGVLASLVVPPRTKPETGKAMPVRLGVRAVWWVDLAASAARAALNEQMHGQQVIIEPSPVLQPSSPPRRTPLTRDQRAHRRQTWTERHAHNQRLPGEGLRIRLHGVPLVLARSIGIFPAREAAA